MSTWDEKLKVFSSEPLHNDASHGSDAFRTLALSTEVVAGINKNKVGIDRHRVNTPLGAALRLDTLFAEREAARNSYRRL